MLYFFHPEQVFKGLPALALLWGFLALPLLIWEQYCNALLFGLDQVGIYNRNQVIGRSLSALSVMLIVGIFGAGVAGVMQANLIGQFAISIAGLSYLVLALQQRGIKICIVPAELWTMIGEAGKLHLNAIGTFMFSSANLLVLSHFCRQEEVGYFQLATQLIGVLIVVPQAASMVIYGKVAGIGPNRAWPDNRRLLFQFFGLVTLLSVIAGLLAPWGIPLLAGDLFNLLWFRFSGCCWGCMALLSLR